MKTVPTAAFLLLAGGVLAQAAVAADLGGGPPPRAVRDAPYVPPVVFSWSGIYVGGHVGYGWTDTDWDALSITSDSSGWLGGGQVGFNWQRGALVLGLEADLSGSNMSGDATCGGLTCSHSLNWLASVRGRAGVAVNGHRTLLYATAGAAWADADYATSAPFGSFSDTHVGWVAGAGIEHMLTSNLTARVEYLYYGFDDVTAPAGTLAAGAVGLDPSMHTVRFGLNFKF
jgi:outer membrane immunogenic protein